MLCSCCLLPVSSAWLNRPTGSASNRIKCSSLSLPLCSSCYFSHHFSLALFYLTVHPMFMFCLLFFYVTLSFLLFNFLTLTHLFSLFCSVVSLSLSLSHSWHECSGYTMLQKPSTVKRQHLELLTHQIT